MEKTPDKIPQCALCNIKDKICAREDGHGPDTCPTLNFEGVIKASLSEYERPSIKEFARYATIQEGECYANRGLSEPYIPHPVKTRVQETIEFAHKMEFKRLGVAFCGGLRREARILVEVLKEQQFEVASVICMVGRTPKEFLGISDTQKVQVGQFESMCSPITQAHILNRVKTDFNIVFGLCVGHDSLFMRYSDALCTVLVTKDRVTGHNPLAALNLHSSYYRRLKKEAFGKGGTVRLTMKEEKQ
ncbi:MAG: DUF1847 domain-containing protein [Deltaproteobacteria bacterium]|nr:DUF1847 domain-containing protein [Deltaproteobacteria bacterium]